MRVSHIALGFASLAARIAAQPYSTIYDPTNSTIFQLSDDEYLGFLLEASFATVIAEGAATGEILRIATQIVPGSTDSLYTPYNFFAGQMQDLANSIDPSVDPVGYRQALFRASTYNRASVSTLVGNSSDPRLFDVWPPMLDQFSRAIALLQPSPGVNISIRAENSSIGAFDIPAYFFKGSASNESLPTVIIGTGYDGAIQDLYHFGCSEVLKRGINCMLYEGPGQATPRRNGLPFIPDWWSVVTPLVDYLQTREDVDANKIALLGDSFGGCLAPLAASKEHRLSAMILLDGYPNFRQSLEEEFGPDLIGLYNASNITGFNQAVTEALASDEIPTSFKFLWDYTFWSLMIEDPYQAWTRLDVFKWGPETAAEIGALPVFVAKGQDDLSTTNEPELAKQYLTEGRPNGANLTYYHEFLTSLGAGEHTSLGAESQVYISVMGWLSQIWGGYKYTDHL